MSKRGHTEEQILRALRQAQGGTKISDICREQGISEATYYVWKKKYAGLELSELCEFRVELLPSGALRGYSRVDLSLASSIFARRYIASVKLSVQGSDLEKPVDFQTPNLDRSGQFADSPIVRQCPRTKKSLILLVELTRIERATS